MTPRIGICNMFRDEASYIREWIRFHHALGVSHFYLFDNGSTDNPKGALEGLDNCKIVVTPWVLSDWTHDRRQCTAFREGDKMLAEQVDWVIHIDVDEFVMPCGGSSLNEALAEFDTDIGVVSINQRVFGANGLESHMPDPVLTRFRRREPLDFEESRFVKSVVRPKTMFRLDDPDYNGWENAHAPICEINARHVFVDGSEYEPGTAHKGFSGKVVKNGPIKLHHYMTKSREEFELKLKRFGRDPRLRRKDFDDKQAVANSVYDDSADRLADQLAIRAIRYS